MRAFAQSYPGKQFVQQLVAQIPWGHNVVLLNSIKDDKERIWYIQRTIENGWSRNVLIHQIEKHYRLLNQTLPIRCSGHCCFSY